MELSPTSDEMWQYCFNIMDDKQFRTCSTFFDYTNYVIDESQKIDTCLYKVNDSNYQKILNNLINTFPKFKENLLKRTQLSNSCICTITNDDFVEGCITMIYSFLKNNKWFNNDIVILYSDWATLRTATLSCPCGRGKHVKNSAGRQSLSPALSR